MDKINTHSVGGMRSYFQVTKMLSNDLREHYKKKSLRTYFIKQPVNAIESFCGNHFSWNVIHI